MNRKVRAVAASFSVSGANDVGPNAVNAQYFFHSSAVNKPVIVGQIKEGTLKTGDTITIRREGKPDITDVIKELRVKNKTVEFARAGSSIGICLTNTRIAAIRNLNDTPAKN